LLMEDQAGIDEKIIAVPVDDLHPFYTDIGSYLDMPKIMREQIAHFFHHYKDLERGKWTRVGEWIDVARSEQLIMESIERAAKRDK
jgi:inorganic pyrophosphatase